jgi:hypothetical protein
MTLRIMLVSLVASLGFELPSGSDVSCWAKAGTEWVQARMVDRPGLLVEAKLDLAAPSDAQLVDEKFDVPALDCEKKADTDASFKSVTDEIAADLSADLLASHREEAPGDQAEVKVALEQPAPAGLPEGEAVGCLVVPGDEAKASEVAWIEEERPTVPAEPTVDSPARPDRVSSAVRLTREALQAWAALMQQSVEECQPTH